MLRTSFLVSTIIVTLLLSDRADAQANANAVTGASDAFGFRNGDESVGIYDETSVRGFSLEAAGNYRVNGSYFVKNSGVSAFFLESNTVQIGYNTFGVVLPGPSGIVNYRLRDPARGEPSSITAGFDVFGQPYAELLLKHRTADNRASFSIGVGRVVNVRDVQGGRGGDSLLVAGAGRLTLGSLIARVFGGEYQYERAGQFRVVPAAEGLPPQIGRGRYLGQDWAREKGQRRIAGVLLDAQIAPRAGVGATLIFSQEDPSRGFTQLIQSPDASRISGSLMIALPQQRSTAWSGELRAHWQLGSGQFAHRFDLTIRGREQRGRIGGATIVPLGASDFGERPEPAPMPMLDDGDARLRDAVSQYGFGLGYRASWQDRLRVNLGLLRTDYTKRFLGADGTMHESGARPWLYNAGLAWDVQRALQLYGSYSRGLEEAGVAPSVASNRNEVLNAIIVTQRELGIRYAPGPSMSFVLAGFDTRKPYAGIDGTTGAYRFLGQVRHRGIEASLSARPVPGLSIVLGGVVLDPRLIAADTEGLGRRPVGVPSLRAIANMDYALPGVPGLSLDIGFTHVGNRPARSRKTGLGAEQLMVDAMTSINLGLRYNFKIARQGFVLRAQLLNAFNQYSWDINASETLAYSPPRRARLVLTALF